jgi:tRNA G46 methylase TrmB
MGTVEAYHRSRDEQHQTRRSIVTLTMTASPLDGVSRQVSSNQETVHPRLASLVMKHLASPARRPLAAHNRHAYEQLADRLPAQLVLDSFCGTGHSTSLLADRFPDHLVVGVDKSANRLARHPGGPHQDNMLLLRADCEDIWQQLALDGIRLAHHYLLYPNPWPKSRHLQRRVHGQACLPYLLQLGGTITLRSNWQIYVEEFGLALHLAGIRGTVSTVAAREPMSLFEKKYRDSGHTLWQYRCEEVAFASP